MSLRHPSLTLDDACAVQAALASLKKAQGARALGWKIGLTSRAMQQALNITIPDSGVLFDYMLFNSGDSLCELSARDPG